METTLLQRLGYFLLTIFGCILVFGMIQGSIQNIISFAGVANEIGFTLMAMMFTVCTGFMTLLK